MFTSIKARVVTFYLLVLLLLLSALGGFLSFSLHRIAFAAIDSSLLSKAKALATMVDNEQGQAPFTFSDDISWEYSSPEATSYFQIRGADGASIQKSISLGSEQLPRPKGFVGQHFQTISLKDHPVRLVDLKMESDPEQAGMSGGAAEPAFVIQCAEDIGERLELEHNYNLVLVLTIAAVMVISAVGGFFIAARALAPLEEISRTIDGISEENLAERVAVENIPKELKVLAHSFNHTFDRLEKSFQHQRRFIADASHEFKTPLAVIVSQSQITLRKPRTEEEYRQALEVILATGIMMSEMAQKLVAIASLDAVAVKPAMEPLELQTILEEALRLLAPLARQSGIELRLDDSTRAPVRGDRQALLEVFVNILDNAIKYNRPGGRVEVSINENKAWIIAVISDNGIGISKQDLENVFDRFYRVDKSRSRERGGSGLGLGIARDLVNLHGGRIRIDSKLDEGTTVRIFLRKI